VRAMATRAITILALLSSGACAWTPLAPQLKPRHRRLAALEPPRRCAGKIVAQEKKQTLTQQWLSRVAIGYREGKVRSEAYFADKRTKTDEDLTNAEPLRQADRIAGVLLMLLIVEAISFGGAVSVAFLMGSSDAFGVGGVQARLFAALTDASSFRCRSRLARLVVEMLALPRVLAIIRRRPTDDRATFVKDRATQTCAAFVALLLTLRACNQALLVGSTAPAALVILDKLGAPLAPLARQIGVAPLTAALGSAGQGAWMSLRGATEALGTLYTTAQGMASLRPLFFIADLETYLAAPARLVGAALGAFVDEVVKPILRTLGFITIQTLG
jgi:hypothetical protein